MNEPVPEYRFAPVCSLENEFSTIKNANNAVIVSPKETRYALLGFAGGGLSFRAIVWEKPYSSGRLLETFGENLSMLIRKYPALMFVFLESVIANCPGRVSSV